MRNRTLKEGATYFAKRILVDGILTFGEIAEYAGLPLDEVKTESRADSISENVGRESKNRFPALLLP